MFSAWNTAIAAAATAGAAISYSGSARADSFGFSVGPGGGVGFSYESGGYCDRWGCPDEFWDYPVSYCPVYFDGEWYRGPMYYRYSRSHYYFWIHGGWHSDGWDEGRPDWACSNEFGPALSYDWYDSHGFRWRDDWRQRWFHRHNNGDRDRRDWGNSDWRGLGSRAFDNRPVDRSTWNNSSGWNSSRGDRNSHDTGAWNSGQGTWNRELQGGAGGQDWRSRLGNTPAPHQIPEHGSAPFAPHTALVDPPRGAAAGGAPAANSWPGGHGREWNGRQPGVEAFTPNTTPGAPARGDGRHDHNRGQDDADAHGRWPR